MSGASTARLAVVGGLAVIVVVLIVMVTSSSGAGHQLRLQMSEASRVVKGQAVKAGGEQIGGVESVRPIAGGKAAEIDLKISDSAWPLPRGSKFKLRWGGSVAFLNRDIVVTPGPRSGQFLRSGQVVPAADVTVPAEFDEIVNTLDAKSRRGLKRMIDVSGPAFRRAESGLRSSLVRAPAAVDQAAHVLTDISADEGSLDTAIFSTGRVIKAVRRSNPSFGQLLNGAAGTFSAIAASEGNLRTTLDRLPTALRQVQTFEKPIDRTLSHAANLTDKLGPGVTELRRSAKPLNGVLSSLRAVSPEAVVTLRTARTNAPNINRLLTTANGISPLLRDTLTSANGQLKCIRPYTPELMGLLTTWADFLSYDDGQDKILRAQVQNFLPANYNAVPVKPADIKRAFPQLSYGFPRPPGFLAGQPWYQPQCGAGVDAVNPSKDKEGDQAKFTIPQAAP